MKGRLGTQFLFTVLVLIVGVLTVLALAAHRTPQVNLSQTQSFQLGNLSEAELKDLVIKLERTTCYGSCPSYKLTISGDGRVEYEGGKNVKVASKKEGWLQPADLKQLLSSFDKANYFSIQSYAENNCSCTLCTDMPTAITEIHLKGTSHRVEHYYGCRCAPKELWELEQSLDSIVKTEQWTGDVSKAGPFGTTCFNK